MYKYILDSQIPRLDLEAYSYGYFKAGYSNWLNLQRNFQGK